MGTESGGLGLCWKHGSDQQSSLESGCHHVPSVVPVSYCTRHVPDGSWPVCAEGSVRVPDEWTSAAPLHILNVQGMALQSLPSPLRPDLDRRVEP